MHERPDHQLAHVAPDLAAGQALAQHAHELDRRRVLGAVAGDEEHGGRAGRPRSALVFEGRIEEIEQQRRAVGVAPLEVVDPHDERLGGGHARQQLAQGAEGAAAQLERIGRVGARRGAVDGVDAQEHGEDAGQRLDVGRDELQGLLLREGSQVLRERVDEAVDALVGHALALVAAALEHHGAVALGDVVEEAMEERALAHARGAVDLERDRLAAPRRAEGVLEHGEVVVAPDEREHLAPGVVGGARVGDDAAQRREDRRLGRPLARAPLEEADAEIGEIVR